MAPKKKKDKGGTEKEKDSEKDEEREERLHREYDTLTETHTNLKRKAEQLRRDNKALQNEVNQIRMDCQEYVSYMSTRSQKRQNAIVTLSDQGQQKLEEIIKQREEMVEKHNEQVNGLKKEILEKETELAQLKLGIAEIEDVKSLQQQLLDRIAELEQEETAACCHQVETLHALKANRLREKKQHKTASKHTVWEYFHKVNKELPPLMRAYMQNVTEENHRLDEELCQLIQRTRALRSQQEFLLTHRKQLLQEKGFMQDPEYLCTTRQCQLKSSCSQLTDPELLDNEPLSDSFF